ncbi:DUF3857 and transglutaminase domain-containing protein [candidate division KSB1 bacterium]|nr:DUF3857 and transglutaminase domain-containing protein [candidate division KSB1 bacterium]
MKRHIILSIVLFWILFIACAGSNKLWKTQVIWDDFKFADLPTQKEYPYAPAVFLLDEGQMEVTGVKGNGYTTFKKHVIIKILTTSGNKFANVIIPYATHTLITEIQARTISPEGKISVLNKENIFDINLYPEYILYSDVRAKSFTFPGVEVGSILEYQYSEIIKGQTYANAWLFQNQVPTLISRFSLSVPTGWDVATQSYLINIEPIKISQANGTRYTWEARNLAEYVIEPGMPPLSQRIKRIEFSQAFLKNWQDIGKWYHNLANERMKPNQALKEFTTKLTQDATDSKEKLSRIYNFVREKIRYVAISIGIGNYQPHFASEVLTNRYGDCKDMSTLIVAMARAVDIPAWPVLISTRQNGDVDTLVVSQTQFNHLIACVRLSDKELYWMDATDKDCAFGELPWYDQERLVLVVQDSGKAKFIKTPAQSSLKNQTNRNWRLRLNETGRLEGQTEWSFTGAAEKNQRRILRSLTHPKLQKEWFAGEIADFCPGSKLDSVWIENGDTIEKPLKVFIIFFAENFADRIDDELIFNGTIMQSHRYDVLFPMVERGHPVHLNYLQQEIDFINLQIPPSMKFRHIPRSHQKVTEWGDYELKFVAQDSNLQIFRQFKTKQLEILTRDYPKWLNFLHEVTRNDQGKIILK